MLGLKYGADTIFPNVLQEFLPSFLLSLPVALFRSPDAAFYAAPLFTALSAVLLAQWVRRLLPVDGNRILFPIFTALMVITAYRYFVIDLLPLLKVSPVELKATVLQAVLRNPYEYNSFYRPHTLGVSYFIFLSFLLWLSKIIDTRQCGWKTVASGIFLVGAQFYSYVFYSMAVGFCLFGAILYLVMDPCSDNRVRNFLMMVVVCTGGLIVAAPSIWNTVFLFSMSENADWLMRIHGFTAVAWNCPNWEVAIMMLLSLLIMPTWSGKVIVSSLALSVLVFENSHKFIGFNIQPGHLYGRVALPIFVTALFVMLYRVWVWFPLSRVRAIQVFVQVAVMGVVLYFTGMAALYAYGYALNNYKTQGLSHSERGVIEYFAEIKPSVVGTLFPTMNEAIAVHTHQYVFMPASQHQPNFATNRSMIERLSIMLWLADADKSKINMFLTQRKGNDERYGYYYFQRTYFPDGPADIEELQKALIEKVEHYRSEVRSGHVFPLVTEGGDSLPDYLILGGWGDAMAKLSHSKNSLLGEVYKNEKYTIYLVGGKCRE
jgi:hypothetical protein